VEELGFVRSSTHQFTLTPRVLSLGMAFVSALGLWDSRDLTSNDWSRPPGILVDGAARRIRIIYVARSRYPS